jgi:diketogulonate reductase-like aldo/keto reductase
MEAEIIPKCEDQGMVIVPWGTLSGGQLLSTEQKKQAEQDPTARKRYSLRENGAKVSKTLELIAGLKNTTVQVVVSYNTTCLYGTNSWCLQALAYLLYRSPYVFPILGVQTSERIKAMPEALITKLSKGDIEAIQGATAFNPLFSMNFLYNFKGGQEYNLSLTATHNQQYQIAAWINAPPKPAVLIRSYTPYEFTSLLIV